VIGPGGMIPILGFSEYLTLGYGMFSLFCDWETFRDIDDEILLEMKDFHYVSHSVEIMNQIFSSLQSMSLSKMIYFSFFLLSLRLCNSSSDTFIGLWRMFLYISMGLKI
jgi:hypothetical protein